MTTKYKNRLNLTLSDEDLELVNRAQAQSNSVTTTATVRKAFQLLCVLTDSEMVSVTATNKKGETTKVIIV